MSMLWELMGVVYGAFAMALAIHLPLMTLLRRKMDIRRFLCCGAIMMVVPAFNYVTRLRGSAISMLLLLACMALCLRVRFGLGGARLAAAACLAFLFTMLCDVLASSLVMWLISPAMLDAWRANNTLAGILITNTLPWLFSPALCGAILLVRRLRGGGISEGARVAFHYVRPVLMLAVTLTVFGMSISRIAAVDSRMGYAEMVASYVSCALLLLLCVTYLIQDVRYLHQLRRNELLEQQKRVNDALMTGMRAFRHNIANMLYGLEGVILSGEPQDVRAYYDDIVRKCTLIHNENIVALQNLPSPAVTALLLRFIDRAREMQIPLHVGVQKSLRWRGLSPADACQALGVLLDNALEGAQGSLAPYVSVEMRNVAGAMEIIVRNTYAASPSGEPPRFDASLKPGHEGVGLASVRGLLRKKRDCFLNLRVSGAYVEAQILMG